LWDDQNPPRGALFKVNPGGFNTSISPTVTWCFQGGSRDNLNNLNNLKSETRDLCVISSTSCGMVADTRTTWKLWRCFNQSEKSWGVEHKKLRFERHHQGWMSKTWLIWWPPLKKAASKPILHIETLQMSESSAAHPESLTWDGLKTGTPCNSVLKKIIVHIFELPSNKWLKKSNFHLAGNKDPILWHCHVIFRHRRAIFPTKHLRRWREVSVDVIHLAGNGVLLG
jgi:hypothetical protein